MHKLTYSSVCNAFKKWKSDDNFFGCFDIWYNIHSIIDHEQTQLQSLLKTFVQFTLIPMYNLQRSNENTHNFLTADFVMRKDWVQT